MVGMGLNDPVAIKEVSFNLPFGIGGVTWEVDESQKLAAWELYVELVTRVAVQPLPDDVGTVREAMTSLYSLFASTREIMREAGPQVGAAKNSVGGIAIAVLNKGLRPFLSKWHPLLQAWEAEKPEKVSPQSHEKGWKLESEVRRELEVLRIDLEAYAVALADIAGVSHELE